MAYLVTGATGFIGRFLVKRLLEDRTGDIHILVREGSEGKAKRLGRSKRLKPVRGDLGEPGLGIGGCSLRRSGRGRFGRRGCALLFLERERAVTGNKCHGQRQRYYDPNSHSQPH